MSLFSVTSIYPIQIIVLFCDYFVDFVDEVNLGRNTDDDTKQFKHAYVQVHVQNMFSIH